MRGVLENAAPPSHLLDSQGRELRSAALPKMLQASPWSTRRMRHDRPRSRVRSCVARLVEPVLDELRIGPARVHVEHNDVGDHRRPSRSRKYRRAALRASVCLPHSRSTRRTSSTNEIPTTSSMRPAPPLRRASAVRVLGLELLVTLEPASRRRAVARRATCALDDNALLLFE